MSILDNLNNKQKEAANYVDGQSLILAGAGSGKTRTITYKIAYMIKECGIDPGSILALTFTNKAAKEMKERVETLVGLDTNVLVSTFHSFAVKILRIYAERLGYGKNFNIYDTNDQKVIIKRLIKSKSLELYLKEKDVMNRISRYKELGINYTNLSNYLSMNFPINIYFRDVFKEYQEYLEKNNAMDFSDLLVNAKELLNDSYVLEILQNKYRYILIDEYQDTNEVQYQIVKKLVSKYQNICVVGDEDQSIYSFRGANIENILNFEKDYPNAKIIKLEQNYRSTQNILNVANSVIKNNKSSKGKKLWSDNVSGDKVIVHKCKNVQDEANYIVKNINEILKKGYNYKDISILYRTNAQSRPIEEVFIKNNIPYKIFGAMQFLERKEIKDLLSYLLLINNNKDDLSFERCINVPKRSIGPKTIEIIEDIARKNECSKFEALSYIQNEFSQNIKSKLIKFKKLIEEFSQLKYNLTMSELINDLIDKVNFYSYLETLENPDDRRENILELINSIIFIEKEEGYLELENFLENILLSSSSDNIDENEDYVKLMSIHSSKGLEFDIVFLIGLEDGIFPRINQNTIDDEIEEERRIFYVALTRSKKMLFLSHNNEKISWDFEIKYNIKRTRFIDEIDKDLIIETANEELNTTKVLYNNKAFIKNNFNNMKIEKIVEIEYDGLFKRGDYVKHEKFGKGLVRSINEKTMEIDFSTGIKKLSTKWAEKNLEKENN